MCRQMGMIFGEQHPTIAEVNYLGKIFTYLLLLGERGGPHATGAVWLKRDRKHSLLKRPQKASDFIRNPVFLDFLAGVDSDVTWLAGHTRRQTVGDASNYRNNHPIRAGEVIGTAHGTITNADDLFVHFNLPRYAQVDSELVFRLAETTIDDQGRIDVATFKTRLALCKGEVSAVMASRLHPQEIVIIKGNKPLEVRYNRARQVVAYASDASYFDLVLAHDHDRSWETINLKPMTIATFSCDCLGASKCQPFELANPHGANPR